MKNQKRIISSVIALILTTIMTTQVWAIDLSQAKNQGLVGETPSGYLAPVGNATPEVQALISDINQKRKAVYQQNAKKNKVSLQAVEKIAGKTAIEKTESGHYIRINGNWQKK